MSNPLDLLFLGSGNAFAPGRYWSSFLLNGRYLFDASPVTLPHLKRSDVQLDEIEAVFISHFHADHFFGLPFLLLEYAQAETRTKDLTIVGPPSLEERLHAVIKAGYPHLLKKELTYRVNYVEVSDGDKGEVGLLEYTAREVTHVPEFTCVGYRAEIAGRSIAYSGDTTMCDALITLADGADVFVVECSCWEKDCGPHLSPDDIRELRSKLGPRPNFILTHLDSGQEDIGVENALVAGDLTRFSL